MKKLGLATRRIWKSSCVWFGSRLQLKLCANALADMSSTEQRVALMKCLVIMIIPRLIQSAVNAGITDAIRG